MKHVGKLIYTIQVNIWGMNTDPFIVAIKSKPVYTIKPLHVRDDHQGQVLSPLEPTGGA